MLSENVTSIRAAEQLQTVTREIRHRLKRHLSSGNDRHLKDIEELIPRAAASIESAEALATSEQERQLAERIRSGHERFEADFRRLSSEPSSIVRREAMLNLAEHVIPDRILAYAKQYINLNEQALDHSNQRNQSTANQLMFGLLLLGTCGGVAGLIAGYGIARLVNRTIVQLAIPIRDTAGKLSQVAGPVTLAAEPGFDDLESILKSVSDHVTTIVQRLQDSERDRQWAEQLAAVGQMAAGLAHELRNPLTSMKTILQLASVPDDLNERDLEILREETERLEQTAQSLLDFARPSQPHMTATNVCELLRQVVALVERQCVRKGIQLNCASQGDAVLLADGVQLRQMILNLLMNAIDVTPRGGSIVLECYAEPRLSTDSKLSTRMRANDSTPSQQNQVVLRVCDTGSGLPKELGDRIFDPFITTKETGTGLGLSICNRIVKCHGGSLTAWNRSESGAIFEARLPLVAPAVSESASPSNDSSEVSTTLKRIRAIGSRDSNGEV